MVVGMGVRFSIAILLTGLASLLGLAGCTMVPLKQDGNIYWPKPPSVPRVVYETTLRTDADLTKDSTEEQLRRLATGQANRGRPVLIKPYDVAAYNGLVVISDTRAGLVHVYDVPRRRVFAIGWRGEGRLQMPRGVALDQQRNIYVADAGNNSVAVYNMLGHFKRYIGNPEAFSRVTDVAVSPDGGRIYVLDRGAVDSSFHRITVFNALGEVERRIGRRGHADGEFNHPSQIELSPRNELVVLDAGNFRVQTFTADGRHLKTWGRLGRHMGQFARPRGLAVDSLGQVYVSDAAFQNFQIFDADGRLLLPVGERRGRGPGSYVLPAGMAVDETNRIYIVDQALAKVEVLRLLTDEERRKLD